MIHLGEIDIMDNLSTELVTGKVRFDCVNVWEPRIINSNIEYSVCLLIPKSDEKTLNDIRKAMENAKEIGINILNYKFDLNIKMLLRDGDIEKSDDEAYKGCYFMYASSVDKPIILDKSNKKINNKEDFYSGCYGYASIDFYAFNTEVDSGIACKVSNIVKVEDGDLLYDKLDVKEEMVSIEAIKLENLEGFMV